MKDLVSKAARLLPLGALPAFFMLIAIALAPFAGAGPAALTMTWLIVRVISVGTGEQMRDSGWALALFLVLLLRQIIVGFSTGIPLVPLGLGPLYFIYLAIFAEAAGGGTLVFPLLLSLPAVIGNLLALRLALPVLRRLFGPVIAHPPRAAWWLMAALGVLEGASPSMIGEILGGRQFFFFAIPVWLFEMMTGCIIAASFLPAEARAAEGGRAEARTAPAQALLPFLGTQLKASWLPALVLLLLLTPIVLAPPLAVLAPIAEGWIFAAILAPCLARSSRRVFVGFIAALVAYGRVLAILASLLITAGIGIGAALSGNPGAGIDNFTLILIALSGAMIGNVFTLALLKEIFPVLTERNRSPTVPGWAWWVMIAAGATEVVLFFYSFGWANDLYFAAPDPKPLRASLPLILPLVLLWIGEWLSWAFMGALLARGCIGEPESMAAQRG